MHRRAGILERVVMELVGWRTRAMLDRYHIVSQADLTAAAEKLDRAAALMVPLPPTLPVTWVTFPACADGRHEDCRASRGGGARAAAGRGPASDFGRYDNFARLSRLP